MSKPPEYVICDICLQPYTYHNKTNHQKSKVHNLVANLKGVDPKPKPPAELDG
jgi:delta-aminolevulinic acid dehydratase/porphobilinogen synthase